MNAETKLKRAVIRKLEIRRFRGVESLDWRPDPDMNLILGGGDTGKTTLLEAVALLFNTSSSATVSETDYWRRDSTIEFSIQAVVALPDSVEIEKQSTLNWPWQWNGADAVEPQATTEGDDVPAATDPVYKLQVRGTPDLIWFGK
jgi:putative ATP-dependent endonuclease of OLD family